nr:hypothetical protein [Micromonospora sp. DSM 115978]
ALLVETSAGYRLWVSNDGTALPLRETGEDGQEVTFGEYDEPVEIETPPVEEVVSLDSALRS